MASFPARKLIARLEYFELSILTTFVQLTKKSKCELFIRTCRTFTVPIPCFITGLGY
jgi:hypothetical protein